ncbi:MAG: HD domain-containing protein [Lachnospiraceae bacterium]|nr:HD domain-containing protein [Lachnospiraceae bacterium]
MDEERFRKQLDFILEIDKEKTILRQTHLTGHGRREDDADHAWHLAVMTWLLSEYANAKIDVGRTMLMVLIHDIVEIDAGDTYAYDKEGKKTESTRENAAADRIFGLLPEDQGAVLRALWEEFNAYETPEARFAHTMDNFQPMLLNNSNGGGDWKEHGIARSQVEERNAKTGTGSEDIWKYMQSILDANVQKGSLKE